MSEYKISDLKLGELEDAFKNLLCAAEMLGYVYCLSGVQCITKYGEKDINCGYILFWKDNEIEGRSGCYLYMLFDEEEKKVVTMTANEVVSENIVRLGTGFNEETIYSLMRVL